jgi:hypothetical protein
MFIFSEHIDIFIVYTFRTIDRMSSLWCSPHSENTKCMIYTDGYILYATIFSYSTSQSSWNDCIEQASLWEIACRILWLDWHSWSSWPITRLVLILESMPLCFHHCIYYYLFGFIKGWYFVCNHLLFFVNNLVGYFKMSFFSKVGAFMFTVLKNFVL